MLVAVSLPLVAATERQSVQPVASPLVANCVWHGIRSPTSLMALVSCPLRVSAGAAAAAAVPGMQLPPGMQMPPPGAAPSDYLAGAMQQPHLLYGHLQMPGQLPGHQMPGMRPPAALGLSHPLADPAEQKPGAGAAATQQQQQQQQQQLPQQGTSPTAAQAAAQVGMSCAVW